jgi:hypothetical protein
MAKKKVGPIEGIAGVHMQIEYGGKWRTARQWSEVVGIKHRTFLGRLEYFPNLLDEDFAACLYLDRKAFQAYREQAEIKRSTVEPITFSPLLLLAHGCPVAMRGAV